MMTVTDHNEQLVLENAALKRRLVEVERNTARIIGIFLGQLGEESIRISRELWEAQVRVVVTMRLDPSGDTYTLSVVRVDDDPALTAQAD